MKNKIWGDTRINHTDQPSLKSANQIARITSDFRNKCNKELKLTAAISRFQNNFEGVQCERLNHSLIHLNGKIVKITFLLGS